METFEGQNWGGCRKIQVILQDYVYFSIFQNSIDFNQISITSGQNFEEIPHIFESAFFRDDEFDTNANRKWEKEVVLKIPKLRKKVSNFLDAFAGPKLVLLVTDLNDITHLLYPVRMTRRRSVPALVTGLNATEVRFYGESTTEAPTVTNLDASP
jgi:hypothetical protein